jgi:hypothetical protein
MSVFEEVFGVPAGHSLRLAVPGLGVAADSRAGLWEHEEYDGDGKLVAIYESWPRAGGGLGFVKYSPYGWVLSISGRSPRHPPQKTRLRPVATASP